MPSGNTNICKKITREYNKTVKDLQYYTDRISPFVRDIEAYYDQYYGKDDYIEFLQETERAIEDAKRFVNQTQRDLRINCLKDENKYNKYINDINEMKDNLSELLNEFRCKNAYENYKE